MRAPRLMAGLSLLLAVATSAALGDSARLAVTGAPIEAVGVPLGDPFPIRRILVAENQIDAAVKEHDLGPVVRMARAEFEAKVQLAASAIEPPRLVEAQYTATLDGGDLAGEAEWTFANRRSSSAIFAMEPFKPAVLGATWADGSTAIMGSFGDDGGLTVRVPPGRSMLKVKWSAAGNGNDADRRFDLRFPTCSTATFALDLPSERTPSNASDILLTGPFPATRDPKLRQWRIRFGERTRLELGIRGPSDASGPTVLTNAVAKYDLANAQLAGTFEFDLRTARGSLAEWLFRIPPGLTVIDATANDRAAWRFDPASQTLRVVQRQAANNGKFVIAATGPLPTGPLPTITPQNAVGGVERVELRVPAGVSLEHLEPGDFRVSDATSTPDGHRLVVLTGSFVAMAGASRKLPCIGVSIAPAEFTSNEALEWRIDSNRVALSARFEIAIRRGPVFGLAFHLPTGYSVDRISNESKDEVSYEAANGSEIEFAKPLVSGQRVVLHVELRGPSLPAGGTKLSFPAFAPIGATEREGRIAFSPGPGWSVSAHPVGETSSDAANGFRYRGIEPGGTVIIAPIVPAFTAALEPEVGRIRVVPTRGHLDAIRIFVPGPPNHRPWTLIGSSNAVAMAIPSPLSFLPAASGTLWTVSLAKPTFDSVTLQTTPGALHVLGAAESHVRSTGEANAAMPGTRAWSFDMLHHVTIASLKHPHAILTGMIQNRGTGPLTIQMPTETSILAVSIGNNTIEPSLFATASGELRLPVPEATGPLRFEVQYRLSTHTGLPVRLASPLPGLPGNPPIARWWAIPSGTSAVWPLAMRSPVAVAPIALNTDHSFFRTDESEIVLMSSAHLEAFGIASAVIITIAGWIGFRLANRTVGVLLLLALLAIGVAFWIGPDAWQRAAIPPMLFAVIGCSAISLARGWNGRAALFCFFIASGVAASAQTPAERSVVLFVNTSGSESAIVPQSLLDRLAVKRSEPSFTIGAASYSGRIEGGLARFTVNYTVHILREGETTLELPLGDVRLERATVDGQPAQPLATKPDVYSVSLAGRGVRDVEIRFAVPIATAGAEREVRFGIPAAPDSHMEFTAPLTTRQLQVVSRNGGERTSRDKDANRISAALGAIRTVHLRWREGPAGSATLAVREGCIWDVSDTSHRLMACYRIQVKAGSVLSFRFEVPANLEPTRVAVRSLDSLLVPTVVRDWSLGKEANGMRPLTIDLLAPADGNVLVTLECEPNAMPVRQPVLTFPRPAGMTRESAIYGLRSNGVVVESIGRTGVIDFAADALTREFGSVPDLRLTPASQVTAFSPRLGETPELKPLLRSGGVPPTATVDATWSVEPGRAVGRGTFVWNGHDSAPWIEFQLATRVQEVRGADLAAWNQTDGRVQVWLKRPMKETSLEWTATAVPAGTFEPPLPVLLNGRNAVQVVRIRPAASLGVRIDRENGWKTIASEGREWAFQSELTPLPAPRVQLFSSGAGTARGFGLLELNGNSIAMRASIEITITPGQPEHLVLHVADATGSAPTLDVPPGTLVRERKEPDGSLAWDVDVAASAASTFRATVSLSLPAKGTIPLPIIDLRNEGRYADPYGVVRTYGLIGSPNGVQLTGATSNMDLAAIRTQWPGEAERLRRAGGTTYQSSGGRVGVVFPFPEAPASPVETPPPGASVPATVPTQHASMVWILIAGWCGASIGVLLLFVRVPRTTWPEQLGLLGAMIGFAIAGQFAWGIAVYVVARNVWLFRIVFNARK